MGASCFTVSSGTSDRLLSESESMAVVVMLRCCLARERLEVELRSTGRLGKVAREGKRTVPSQ